MGPLLDKALWRDIHGLDDAASCRLIREDRLDIVVFLLGNTSRDRTLLPTHRVAPVQVNMLAMFSSGVDHMDYWIADRHSVPQPPQAHAGSDPEYFSETILHLPHVFCFAPVEWAPEVGPLPAATAGQGVTFGCFSLADKLNPDCIRGMARVLHRIDGARLLLKTKAQTYGQPASRKWVLDQFAVEGIEPSRLSFLPPTEAIPDHLAQYNQVDIALDTFPYTGRLTIYDSLWMGVPIITLGGGDRFIHREGASVLQAAGLAELIAETPSDYVDKAAALASDLTKLAELRRNLRSRVQASALCDGAGYVRSLEQAYRKIWAERCRLWH